MGNPGQQLPKSKQLVFASLAVTFALAAFLLLAELALRVLPIPGIKFNVSRYDPLVGVGYHPHTLATYRSDSGVLVRRRINAWGYLDTEHEREKPLDTYRIGFFGDSYTEAMQVPLERTFFRLIADSLRGEGVESLSFGTSGFGTFQSYLNSLRWAPFFGLDLVVYVFCENDVTDNLREFRGSDAIPFPLVQGDSLTADNSFRRAGRNRLQLPSRVIDYLTAHSLVFSTLSQRTRLLLRRGVRVRVTERDRTIGAGGSNGNEVLAQKPLWEWPDSLRRRALRTEEAILGSWRRALPDSASLAIFYVPRAEEMDKPTERQNSWKRWLAPYCEREHIPFIDPTSRFLAARLRGEEIYHDHFTSQGHREFANVFVKWFRDRHATGGRPASALQ